ncbi:MULTISPECIES: DUF5677 domain-containing protein [Paraburkholderia]|jgi:hypothetical protein|uniref:Uncharacterized protein n=1 Tax=Paraburkholderia phenazinium TaxID=60549 RepID=A0A1N6JBY3_9BURK|nr:DUF5677 domain-containing protein [Paraburkholderia phenazinium]SIO41639.1 hypothetical protein SAMN05444165_2986 [Paraburkholderia phenazinium]SIO50131.1 hypothetical protein SAMN05444168_5671 [Paraburkholderia phenazinium]
MASFDEVGFLSDDLEGWQTAARELFAGPFEFAGRANEMGMRMRKAFDLNELREEVKWAIAGFVRALGAFQGGILMASRGALPEARALARLCTESVIVTAGLAKVEGTLERLREDDAAHDLGVCNRVLELNGNDAGDERLEIFRRRKAEIEAQYDRPRSLKLATLAHESDLTLLYELSYRFTSGNGAHATLGAFVRHMREGIDGEPDAYFFGPDTSDMASTLLCANAAAIHLINLAVDSMGLGEFNAERGDLTLHWNILRPDLEAASAAEGLD